MGKLESFATIKEAKQRVLDLGFGEPKLQHPSWTLSQLLQHLAQSIEFSMQGYPEMKGAVFRAVVGNTAFAVFNLRGAMSHNLADPIPGAPLLDKAPLLKDSIARLLDALNTFERWTGPLKPHFAYGELDKAQYTRAHLMHLADHWQQIHIPPAKTT
ncbi:DUF1569 domain-containing protein [Inhella gelatinilytica]|uniref:DUF1569 domain-containing protein n=1 Tax=Inhella gelatinilytica TaxID=2795030 RepID=A0A931IWI8_9BURK|nr:DUF1569 domain-containing protein [Inhella gelatinilytica]MBH9552315.1 DUF1569 domain-containing protein [Inhella gelatinilytica]